MSKTIYEEYLKRYGSLTYKNTGTSMLPLLKQGRDAFIVRAVGEYETCKKWDVVLYKRPPESYVLHRVVRVLGNSASFCILVQILEKNKSFCYIFY